MPSSHLRPILAAAAVLLAAAGSPAAWAGHGHGGRGGHSGTGHTGGGASLRSGGHAQFQSRPMPAPAAASGWHGGGAVAGGPRGPHGLRDGHWFHGVRGGQVGWWWIAAAPAYVVLQSGYPAYAPGAVAVEPVYGYFCSSLQRYYPEVQACPEPWTVVVPAE